MLHPLDNELIKHESEFSAFRSINATIVSWSLDSAKPDVLVGCLENVSFLHDALTSIKDTDVIASGFQVLIDLENCKMAARDGAAKWEEQNHGWNLFLRKVITTYKKWFDCLVLVSKLLSHGRTVYIYS